MTINDINLKTSDFTFVSFHVNMLLDKNIEISIDEMIEMIDGGKVLNHLWKRHELDFDMSLFESRPEVLDAINIFFSELTGMNHRRKLGVENNGLCLLLGYCLEGIQRSTKP